MRNLRLLFLVGLATGFISEKLFVSSQFTTDDLYIEGQTSGDLPIDDEDGVDDGSGSGSGDYPLTTLKRFTMTTVSKEMLPSQPQPTADFAHNTLTTAAESKDPPTTVKDTQTPLLIFPNGDSADEEITSPSSTNVPAIETTASNFGIDISVTEDTDEDNSLDKWDISPTKAKDIEVSMAKDENEILGSDGRGGRMFDVDRPELLNSGNMWERTDVLAAVIACGVVGFLCAVFLLLLLAYRMKKKDEGSYDLGDTKLSNTTYHKAPTKEFYA